MTPGGRSAIVVALPVPPSVQRVRARFDPMAARGVPPHVTLLFPFVPADALQHEHRGRIAEVVGALARFEIELDDVRRLPSLLYLVPTPAAPLSRLIEALAATFPDYPPYGGAVETVIPHLTVAADVDEATMRALEPDLRAVLPVRASVRSVTVLVEGPDGRWHTRWRIPLGNRTA